MPYAAHVSTKRSRTRLGSAGDDPAALPRAKPFGGPPTVSFAVGGIVIWAIIGLALLPFRQLSDHGHTDWLWIPPPRRLRPGLSLGSRTMTATTGTGAPAAPRRPTGLRAPRSTNVGHMPTRTSSAQWQGSLKRGSGTMKLAVRRLRRRVLIRVTLRIRHGYRPGGIHRGRTCGLLLDGAVQHSRTGRRHADVDRHHRRRAPRTRPDGFGISRIDLDTVGDVPGMSAELRGTRRDRQGQLPGLEGARGRRDRRSTPASRKSRSRFKGGAPPLVGGGSPAR